jgi:hypothetical protein
MTPNLEFIERLKAELRKNPDEYNQSHFKPPLDVCGTPVCIGGHAYLLAGHSKAELLATSTYEIASVAERAMGFSHLELDTLFGTVDSWPLQYRFSNRVKPKTRVEKACNYIDALVQAKMKGK